MLDWESDLRDWTVIGSIPGNNLWSQVSKNIKRSDIYISKKWPIMHLIWCPGLHRNFKNNNHLYKDWYIQESTIINWHRLRRKTTSLSLNLYSTCSIIKTTYQILHYHIGSRIMLKAHVLSYCNKIIKTRVCVTSAQYLES